eukprot:m.97019 g.97019  ORF g.97019 m.97019 type:complete len:291 (+) comp13573_c1_seq1:1784-2656(+)
MASSEGKKFGFVGCGTIVCSIVRGLCEHYKKVATTTTSKTTPVIVSGVSFPLFLSPRNSNKTAALAAEYGASLVVVCASNQDVISQTDVVVVGLTPPVAPAVLPSLTFRSNQLVINLISTISNSEMASLCTQKSEEDSDSRAIEVIKAVPLPPVAHHKGATAVYPRNPTVNSLFTLLGKVVEVDTAEQLTVMQAATALMGPYYQLVGTLQRWMSQNGIPDDDAATFSSAFFQCVSVDLENKNTPEALQSLVDEQTPGGLNQEAIERLTAAGTYDTVGVTLDSILARLRHK